MTLIELKKNLCGGKLLRNKKLSNIMTTYVYKNLLVHSRRDGSLKFDAIGFVLPLPLRSSLLRSFRQDLRLLAEEMALSRLSTSRATFEADILLTKSSGGYPPELLER